MVSADELRLQEIVDHLQKYLIEIKSEWVEKILNLFTKQSSQSSNLLKSPDKVFKSPYFASLSEKSLTSIIKRDDLKVKEVEVWEHVLKWDLARNLTLIPDPKTWNFKVMENTIQYCSQLYIVRNVNKFFI